MAIEWTIYLANGEEVPTVLVEALDELEQSWPGATFGPARPAIVDAILKAQQKLGSN